MDCINRYDVCAIYVFDVPAIGESRDMDCIIRYDVRSYVLCACNWGK